MTALFVSVAGAVLGLCLAARSLRAGRRGRAAAGLARLLPGPGSGAAPGPRQPRPERAARGPARMPFPFGYLNRRLAEGALGVSGRAVALVALTGALASFAAASLVLGSGWPADLALAGGLLAPLVWIDHLASLRREAIAQEMERVASALQGAIAAGLVPYEALLEVGVATGGVLGPELLRTVADADRIGLSEALLLLRTRLPLPEVRLLVAALRLGQGAGAELAGSLQALHRTLRERREAAGAMRAATASGRYQAGLLVAVPPVLLAFMRLVYPAFEAPLFRTAGGHALLAAAACWVLIGYLVVRRMSVPREVISEMARILFGAVLLGAVALLLGAEAIVSGRNRRLLEVLLRLEDQRLAELHGERVAALLRRAAGGLLRRTLDGLAPLARLGLGAGGDAARRLVWAGAAISSEQFAALRLLGAVAGAVAGVGAGALAGNAGIGAAAGSLGAVAGHALPDAWLGGAVARRHRAIDGELLYFLDFLALAARAGLPLEAALDHVARELPGVLGASFARVRAEQGMGQWNEHALAGLAQRLGHREVTAVVEALVRAGRFGSASAALLQELAGSIRTRRSLAAQEHAGRAGAAIVLPVAVFILPAVVLVLGYPAVATVAGALGGR